MLRRRSPGHGRIGHGATAGGEKCEIITADRASLDLREQAQVRAFFQDVAPNVVVLAAAKVGGIAANDASPANFLYENLAIELNVIESAFASGVEKLLFLGSSCIYPKFAPQPIPEEALLTGALEPTNEWYAIAKIAGLKLCEAYHKQYGANFISAMPTNLYGPGDNFDLNSSHVIPALIRKAHEAKRSGAREWTVWGSGAPRREFLHVDDCAEALAFLLTSYSGGTHVNIGAGVDISIADLARLISGIVDLDAQIVFDTSMPDGTPRKLMDSQKLMSMGWAPRIDLREGLRSVYQWYLENNETARKVGA
ncbi:MAG: GDP-L-fucose synthase [Parvularculaceae bacterium]